MEYGVGGGGSATVVVVVFLLCIVHSQLYTFSWVCLDTGPLIWCLFGVQLGPGVLDFVTVVGLLDVMVGSTPCSPLGVPGIL